MNRVVVGTISLVVYAWFASGVQPFTLSAYILIAIPALACLCAYVLRGGFSRAATERYRARSRAVSLGSVAPWLVIALVAVALEVIGLALGGRSPDVPTLSTAADHLLKAHVERAILYAAWLAAGIAALSPRRRAAASS